MAMPFSARASRIIGSRSLDGKYPSPIDVTGKPTPPELIKGAPGVTYIRAIDIYSSPTRRRYRAFLNGEEVTNSCSETDVVAGWARLYRIDPEGDGKSFEIRGGGGGWRKLDKASLNSREKWIEVDPPQSVEFIHFGRVELR